LNGKASLGEKGKNYKAKKEGKTKKELQGGTGVK